jgi:arylsulfatase A
MHDYFDWRIEWNNGKIGRGDGRYLTDVWTEEAVQFIHRHQKDPFFLHVNYNAPHTPLQAPDHYIRSFEDRPGLNWGVRCIYAMLKSLDEGVARILDALKRGGLAENTLVIFSSDNGPQFGGKGEEATTRFNCNWHGAKGSTYEGGIRVPGLLRWPAGGLAGGRTVDKMVHFTDYLPTILAAAGVENRSGGPGSADPDTAGIETAAPCGGPGVLESGDGCLPIDGTNVLPVLRGESGEVCTSRCWQWNRYSPIISCNAAIRDGDWKLVRPVIREAMQVPDIKHLHTSMYNTEYFIENGIFKGGPERDIPDPPPAELYNIAEDPLEETDTAAQHPDLVKRLADKLEKWFEEVEKDRKSIDDEWIVNPESGW